MIGNQRRYESFMFDDIHDNWRILDCYLSAKIFNCYTVQLLSSN